MNLESSHIETLLPQVREEYLRRMTGGDSSLLRQVEAYTAGRTGKMLRPRMLLAAASSGCTGVSPAQCKLNDHPTGSQPLAPNSQLPRRTLLLAVAVEMLHNASLLHDDVIDRDITRRGQPSVNARWNNAVAVLVGDYHLVSIMQLLDEIGERQVSQRFNDTVKSMVEAELLQQELDTEHLTLDSYLRIIDGKTANLFALAAELGNPALRDYGLHYGRLFQLRDDLADGEATPFTEELIRQEEKILQEINK